MAVVLVLLSTLALQTKKKTDGFVIHFVETDTLELDPCAGKTAHLILETMVRTAPSLLLTAVELDQLKNVITVKSTAFCGILYVAMVIIT